MIRPMLAQRPYDLRPARFGPEFIGAFTRAQGSARDMPASGMHHDVGTLAKTALREPAIRFAARAVGQEQLRGTGTRRTRRRQTPEEPLRGFVADADVAVRDALIERPVEYAR